MGEKRKKRRERQQKVSKRCEMVMRDKNGEKE